MFSVSSKHILPRHRRPVRRNLRRLSSGILLFARRLQVPLHSIANTGSFEATDRTAHLQDLSLRLLPRRIQRHLHALQAGLFRAATEVCPRATSDRLLCLSTGLHLRIRRLLLFPGSTRPRPDRRTVAQANCQPNAETDVSAHRSPNRRAYETPNCCSHGTADSSSHQRPVRM